MKKIENKQEFLFSFKDYVKMIGLHRRVICEKLNISPDTYYSYSSGRRKVPYEIIERLDQIYKIIKEL